MQDRIIEEMQGDLAHIDKLLLDHQARKVPSLASDQEKAKRRAANKRARKARRR